MHIRELEGLARLRVRGALVNALGAQKPIHA
jgi:hypothetical protein